MQLRVWNSGTGDTKLVTLAPTRRLAGQQAEQLAGRVRSTGDAQSRLSVVEACPACEPTTASSAERGGGSGSVGGSVSRAGSGSQVSAAFSSEEDSWSQPPSWSVEE